MTSYELSSPTPSRWSFKSAIFASILAFGGLLLASLGLRYLGALSSLRQQPSSVQESEPVETPLGGDNAEAEAIQAEELEEWRLKLRKDIAASEEEELGELPGFLSPNEKSFWGPHWVFFAPNSSQPEATSANAIAELAEHLKAHPELRIWVVGYADSLEESRSIIYEEGLKELSLKRAEAVVQELKNHGVEPERIQCRGEGSAFPIDLNRAQASCHNRRVMSMFLPLEVSETLFVAPKQLPSQST